MDDKGKPIVKKDDKKHVIYDSRKGDFVLEENVVPEYQWFNGKVHYTLVSDKIDPTKVVEINHYEGSPTDGKSMIWPVKVFRGKQPYDKVNLTLVTPHTAGDDKTGYWKNFVWDKAIASGMATTARRSRVRSASSRPRCAGRSPIWLRPRRKRWAVSNATARTAASKKSPASTCGARCQQGPQRPRLDGGTAGADRGTHPRALRIRAARNGS